MMTMELSPQQQQEAIELLQALIRINTTNPPGNEAVLACLIADWLQARGVDSQLVTLANGRANLVARVGKNQGGPALLFTGHLDTVPAGSQPWRFDPFAAERHGDLIYGRGASDMKGGLAAMLYSLTLLAKQGTSIAHDIVLLATAGEEVNCCGAQAFVDSGGMVDIAAAVVGEPSNGDVMIAHKGAAWIEVTTHGSTAHGSMPHLGINAIMLMNDLLAKLTKQTFAVEPNRWLGAPTLSVNKIHGGVATNVVPDACSCELDIRLIPGQTLQAAIDLINAAIAEVKQDQPAFKADVRVISYREPIACPDDHPVIEYAQKCAGAASVRGVNYYTDASVLLLGRGLPVIFYGPGDDAQAHQPNEHISIAKYLKAIQFYKEFAANYTIGSRK